MQCCARESGTNRVLPCRKPANPTRAMPNLQGFQEFGSVLGRGVEGGEVGEGTPPPSWMSETWLKHLGEREME